MQTDLRNLLTQQEIYRSTPANNLTYAPDMASLGPDITLSRGVTVSIVGALNTGWGASASHAALAANQTCALFSGTVSAIPAPAQTSGVIACTNDQ
jgi:hypothetical protein